MHAGFLWRGPAGGIHTGRSTLAAVFLLPLDEQRDGIFRLGRTSKIGRDTGRGRSRDLDRSIRRHHALADIDVVAVEVVRDVAVLAGPGFEGLELRLGLRHVAVEVVELSERVDGSVARVGVGWVVSLVVLDVDEDVVFARFFHQVLVLGQQLDRGLGDHDVDLALDGVESDWVVSGVGGEDGDGIAWAECVDGGLVGIWVALVVCRKGVEGCVEVVVDVGDVLVQMLT